MTNRLDIIVFGATGFTGMHVLPYLHRLCPNYKGGLTWGVAGRSEKKLKSLLLQTAELLRDDNLNSTPIVIADVANEDSILQMTQKARIIINCCGPYIHYGEVVVKSCIETGTHYVDVTGESYFEELMEVKYHEAAGSKGVYIVSSCGFDSINSELSLAFLEKTFSGTINSVEFFINLGPKSNDSGSVINYGTWESAVTGIGQYRDLCNLRKERNLTPVPKMQPKISMRIPCTTDATIGIPEKKVIPFPSPDLDVIKRTQRYFYEKDRKRPLQVRYYYLEESWINIFLLMCFAAVVLILSQFSWGRKLLLDYPKFFTAGMFSHESPSEELIKNSEMDVYFYGKGWDENITENQNDVPPNKAILGRLNVINPGYGFTCLAVSLSAILILTQPSNLPAKGGVYTPGVAFSKTSFVEEFKKNDVQLQILYIKDL